MDSQKWMYLSLGLLLAIMVIIDFAFPLNVLVQKYIPNLVTEILGIFFVVAFVDRLLTNERKRENERFQELERIKTVGINIRSLPDDQVKQLEAEFEKLWELGLVGGRESKEAIMSQLHQISFFAFNEKNKLTYLIKAIQKQFLELVGPDNVPFNEDWKEDLILEGLDIVDFICEISGYIYNKEFFTQVQETIQYFIDVAIDYKKEKIASKCFNTIENIEKYAIENIDNGEREAWEKVASIIIGHLSTMKDSMYEKIKQKNYGWNLK